MTEDELLHKVREITFAAVGDGIQRVVLHNAIIDLARAYAASKQEWRTIDSAPKTMERSVIVSPEILGVDKYGEIRVVRWSVEYPHTEGVWKYAWDNDGYIGSAISIEPTHWMPLPQPPKSEVG